MSQLILNMIGHLDLLPRLVSRFMVPGATADDPVHQSGGTSHDLRSLDSTQT